MIQYLLVLAYLLLATTVESLVPLKPHLVTGYWQNWNAPSSGGLIQLRDVSPLYDVVAIAFAIQGSPAGSLSFTLYSGVTNFKSDVALLNTRGQSVVLSIGGATGNINLQSEEDADAFANSAYSIMTEYGFDGVDIDIENKFDNPELIVSALRKLKVLFGEYYIFMAPQTVNVQAAVASSQWADYLYIIDEIGDDITLVNTQVKICFLILVLQLGLNARK
jgi:chitinase